MLGTPIVRLLCIQIRTTILNKIVENFFAYKALLTAYIEFLYKFSSIQIFTNLNIQKCTNKL